MMADINCRTQVSQCPLCSEFRGRRLQRQRDSRNGYDFFFIDFINYKLLILLY
jgi:hypothetical protein